MKLQAINIGKVKRLSLRESKLPAIAVRSEPPTYVEIAKPPTEEEIAYSIIVAKYPTIEKLVDKLSLVSCNTGEPISKVAIPEGYKVPNKARDLKEIAERIIQPERAYSKEEVLKRIVEETKVSIERAERGLTSMIEAKAIERTGELFFLGGSTPF